MNMRKIVKIVASIVVLVGGFFVMRRASGPKKPVVAILQSASHPALDAARCGFIDAFTAGMGTGYSFLVKNADGSVANAQTIAQSLTSRSDVVAFVGLGTPAAQALLQKESEKPIFFTAVTYPQKAGLEQKNIAGFSDYFDLRDLVKFAHAFVPKALRVGVLYNPGADVALQEMKEIKHSCREQGLSSVRIAGATEADILGSLKSSLRKIDVCVAPADNTIATVMPALADMCKQANIPMIVADKTLVSSGPVAGLGMDYYHLGFSLGKAATRVFLHECSAGAIGTVYATPTVGVNEDVLVGLQAAGVQFDLSACNYA